MRGVAAVHGKQSSAQKQHKLALAAAGKGPAGKSPPQEEGPTQEEEPRRKKIGSKTPQMEAT